jgi:hypothetical protein
MHPEIEALLDQAENRFLKAEELTAFKRQAATLSQRLKIYEFLREKEESIFQPVANKLQEIFPDEKQETLERSLQTLVLSLALLRYGHAAQRSSFSRTAPPRLAFRHS